MQPQTTITATYDEHLEHSSFHIHKGSILSPVLLRGRYVPKMKLARPERAAFVLFYQVLPCYRLKYANYPQWVTRGIPSHANELHDRSTAFWPCGRSTGATFIALCCSENSAVQAAAALTKLCLLVTKTSNATFYLLSPTFLQTEGLPCTICGFPCSKFPLPVPALHLTVPITNLFVVLSRNLNHCRASSLQGLWYDTGR
ncbi:hypothetical protein OF83DRAFT_939027 [Amylostereum chailletii]|nr:hypothetical protein OF83DRAFT_939027 [Amylostereum chailletii]